VKLFQGASPDQAYSGKYFCSQLTTTFIYFFVDLAWVSQVPTCVKSPDTIIKVRDMLSLNIPCFIGEIFPLPIRMRVISVEKRQNLSHSSPSFLHIFFENVVFFKTLASYFCFSLRTSGLFISGKGLGYRSDIIS
jgi:hypothetical protein